VDTTYESATIESNAIQFRSGRLSYRQEVVPANTAATETKYKKKD